MESASTFPDVPAVVGIEGIARGYEWGSSTAVQRLLGTEIDGRPIAELWFGAHRDAPATVPLLGTSLDQLIAADPAGALGDSTSTELPFLLKVLAAERPPSLQVHPTVEQARAGYAREEAAGIPLDSNARTYRDTNHKPELLYALTPFEALCGFRPLEQTSDLLSLFDVPELDAAARLLGGVDGLRRAFTSLVRAERRAEMVESVTVRAQRLPSRWGDAARAVELTAAAFPADIGIVLSLLLNYVTLDSGEAVYLGAGSVHSYLRGTGIEIMANSDNVVRCGLTHKHVDADEMLAVTAFVPVGDPRVRPGPDGRFAVPGAGFALQDVRIDRSSGTHRVTDAAPRIVLCTEGAVEVRGGGAVVGLVAGRAAFVRADCSDCTIAGTGRVAVGLVDSGANRGVCSQDRPVHSVLADDHLDGQAGTCV